MVQCVEHFCAMQQNSLLTDITALLFHGFFHFTVVELEWKKFSVVNLRYEVGERRNYKKSMNIFKTIYCVNISFAKW